MPQCPYCLRTFIPHLKSPNVCTDCYKKYIMPIRHKYGLERIPPVNKEVVKKREREKKRFNDWYREEMQSDNFGKKIVVKRKVGT